MRNNRECTGKRNGPEEEMKNPARHPEKLKKADGPTEPLSDTAYTVVVFGKTGSGKSSVLNKLIQQAGVFPESNSLQSKTGKCDWKVGYLGRSREKCLVIDTPGFYDSENRDRNHIVDMISFLRMIKDGFTMLLYTFSMTEMKFDPSLPLSMQMLAALIGPDVYKHTRLILTQGNMLSKEVFTTQLKKLNEELPKRLQAANILIPHPFHVFEYMVPDGRLKPVVDTILGQPQKVRPAILELVAKNIDITDPMAMWRALLESSHEMNAYAQKVVQRDTMVHTSSAQCATIERERENMQKRISEISEEKQMLQAQLKQNETAHQEAYAKQHNEFCQFIQQRAEQDFAQREASLQQQILYDQKIKAITADYAEKIQQMQAQQAKYEQDQETRFLKMQEEHNKKEKEGQDLKAEQERKKVNSHIFPCALL